MINIDWNGYDNASRHSTQFYVDCDIESTMTCTQQTSNQKVDKHESVFAKLISAYEYLIKKWTNWKWNWADKTNPLNFRFAYCQQVYHFSFSINHRAGCCHALKTISKISLSRYDNFKSTLRRQITSHLVISTI